MSTRARSGLLGALAVALVATAVVGGAGAAHAHGSTPVAATPGAGEVLADSPERVTLVFAEDLASAQAQVSVLGPDGEQLVDGPAQVDGAALTVPLRDSAFAGEHALSYRALSRDGASITGRYAFTVTSGDPTPAPVSPGSPAAPVVDAASAVPSSASAEPLPAPASSAPEAQTAGLEQAGAGGDWRPLVAGLCAIAGLALLVASVSGRRGDGHV